MKIHVLWLACIVLPGCGTIGPFSCGSTMCRGDQVCMVSGDLAGPREMCIDDPCPGRTLSCSCAPKVCGPTGFVCDSANGRTLECSCPAC